MTKNIKYYLYLSRVKVEMLWEQLSREDIEKISTELKLNIGIFSGSLKSEAKDENIYAKLNVALTYLESKELIGTLKKPKKFFKASIPMTWREVKFFPRNQSNERMVLFSGYDLNSNCSIGLIGSASHVIGMNNLDPATLDYAQPSFWMKVMEELNPPKETEIDKNLYDLKNEIVDEATRIKDSTPKQNLEFVAKTFLFKKGLFKKGFLLGSPIYVSETELL